MYHVTIYDAIHPGRPSLCTPLTQADLFALIYLAGKRGDGIIVQEYDSSDQYGERLTDLWESTHE